MLTPSQLLLASMACDVLGMTISVKAQHSFNPTPTLLLSSHLGGLWHHGLWSQLFLLLALTSPGNCCLFRHAPFFTPDAHQSYTHSVASLPLRSPLTSQLGMNAPTASVGACPRLYPFPAFVVCIQALCYSASILHSTHYHLSIPFR